MAYLALDTFKPQSIDSYWAEATNGNIVPDAKLSTNTGMIKNYGETLESDIAMCGEMRCLNRGCDLSDALDLVDCGVVLCIIVRHSTHYLHRPSTTKPG